MNERDDLRHHQKAGMHGFTLIELLVVIAIIAILAAILFPVFVAAKESANKDKCLSNMKQMGMAFRLYADSNNDTYPTTDHNDARQSWLYGLQQYSNSKLVGMYPSDTSKNWTVPIPPDNDSTHVRRTTYAVNWYFSPSGPNDNPPDPITGKVGPSPSGYIRDSMVMSVSKSIYICELKTNSYADHVHPAYWPYRIAPDNEINTHAHNGGGNYAFLDGHVQWMHFEQTFDYPKNINLWDPW